MREEKTLRHIPKLNTPKSNAPTTSINHVHSIKPFLSTAVLFPLLPSVCHAADGSNQNAFLVPLAISIFTMVPFLYYQQALKPKPRTVQQIELDEKTLKPKVKSTGGKEGEARAGKR